MSAALRILLVDDDESIREFIRQALEDEGYEVITAAQGADALKMVDQTQLNLILLDLHMPGMDGWGFLEAYRSKPGSHAPVVALTASSDKTDPRLADEVSGFLAKPFNLVDLIDLVRCLVSGAATG